MLNCKMAVVAGLSFVIAVGSGVAAVAQSPKSPNLLKVCNNECPKAKSNAAVLTCTEEKMKDKAFGKTTCGLEVTKYKDSSHEGHDHQHGGDDHSHGSQKE